MTVLVVIGVIYLLAAGLFIVGLCRRGRHPLGESSACRVARLRDSR